MVGLKEFTDDGWDFRVVIQPLNIIECTSSLLIFKKTTSVLKVNSINIYFFKKEGVSTGQKIIHSTEINWESFENSSHSKPNPVFAEFNEGNEAMKTQVTGYNPSNPELSTFLNGDKNHPLFGFE